MEKFAYSIKETASLIGLGYVKTCELMTTGELETFTVGRRRLCSPEAIQKYISRREAAERRGAGILAR